MGFPLDQLPQNYVNSDDSLWKSALACYITICFISEVWWRIYALLQWVIIATYNGVAPILTWLVLLPPWRLEEPSKVWAVLNGGQRRLNMLIRHSQYYGCWCKNNNHSSLAPCPTCIGNAFIVTLNVRGLSFSGSTVSIMVCWCPGSLCRQDISIHDIDYVK